MGRKLIGLTIGFLLTIVLAFYLFPAGYSALIRWLAPYFGPWLRFVFMFLFVIFGDFFSFIIVGVIWAVVGIIVGLFVRTIGGAIGISIAIFTLTFLMLVVGIIAMIIPGLFGGGMSGFDFLAFLGAVPPDVSIFEILSAPVIGPIINNLLGGIGGLLGGMGGGSVDFGSMLTMFQETIIMYIVLPVVKNLILLGITAAIGAVIGRRIFGPGQ